MPCCCPGALVTFLLILFALGLVLFLAFRANDGSLLGAGFTASNFLTLALDPLYLTVTLRSLAIAGLVTLATVVTAYPVAYYLAFHAGRRRGLLLFLVTLPFWTSYLLRVFAWKIVLAYNGVLNSALIETGVDGPSRRWPSSTRRRRWSSRSPTPMRPSPSCRSTSRWKRSRNRCSKRQPISARGRSRRFRRVVLPNSMPGVLAAALVVFVPTVGDYVTPALVGGPASTMIGSLIQAAVRQGQ